MKILSVIGKWLFAAVLMTGFIIGFCLQSIVLDRQTRTIDEVADFTSPIKMKGVIFYVTPNEAQIYHYDHLFMVSCVIVIGLAFGISSVRRFNDRKNGSAYRKL